MLNQWGDPFDRNYPPVPKIRWHLAHGWRNPAQARDGLGFYGGRRRWGMVAFAGLNLEGSILKVSEDSNKAYYGKAVGPWTSSWKTRPSTRQPLLFAIDWHEECCSTCQARKAGWVIWKATNSPKESLLSLSFYSSRSRFLHWHYRIRLRFGRGVQPLSYTILSSDNLPRKALIYYRWVGRLSEPAFFSFRSPWMAPTPLLSSLLYFPNGT